MQRELRTHAIASLALESPQGNGNQASLILQSGEQTARLRTDLFEGDPSQPVWMELTSLTGCCSTGPPPAWWQTDPAGSG